MNNIVLLFSTLDDALTKAIFSLSKKVRGRVDVFDVKDFAQYIDVADWPITLAANYPETIVNKFENAYVINRVFDLMGTNFADISRRAHCNHAWLQVVLNKLIKRAKVAVHDTGPRGVSKSLQSLSAQWWYVSQSGLEISIPKFAFGFNHEQPNLEDMRTTPLRRTPWSFFDWTESGQVEMPDHSRHPFFVERPAGVPVVHYYLEDEGHNLFLGDTVPINVKRLDAIRRWIRKAFKSHVGEFLIFIDNDEITFGAFSPYMDTAASNANFPHIVDKWISGVI